MRQDAVDESSSTHHPSKHVCSRRNLLFNPLPTDSHDHGKWKDTLHMKTNIPKCKSDSETRIEWFSSFHPLVFSFPTPLLETHHRCKSTGTGPHYIDEDGHVIHTVEAWGITCLLHWKQSSWWSSTPRWWCRRVPLVLFLVPPLLLQMLDDAQERNKGDEVKENKKNNSKTQERRKEAHSHHHQWVVDDPFREASYSTLTFQRSKRWKLWTVM